MQTSLSLSQFRKPSSQPTKQYPQFSNSHNSHNPTQLSQFLSILPIPPILPVLPVPLNSSCSPGSSNLRVLPIFGFFQFFPIHNPVAMAMAMGVASLAVTAPKHALVTPRASADRGEKQGFLDWFRTAMDKDSLSEMDAVLAKGGENGKGSENSKGSENANGKARSIPPKNTTLPKGAASPPKRGGFSFFGKK